LDQRSSALLQVEVALLRLTVAGLFRLFAGSWLIVTMHTGILLILVLQAGHWQ
jgi:hypothetical protein